jgi:hypothetical protein
MNTVSRKMLTRGILFFVWGGLSLGLIGSELSAQENNLQGWNAAVNYWQAFGLMPEWTEQERQLRQAIPDELSRELPQGVKELTERSSVALKALELANRVEKCDWQLDYAQGPMLPLPHSQKARELARQSVLRARYRFSQGDNVGGISDALSTIRLARAIGTEQILISVLVEAAIERSAIELLAAYLPNFNEAERKQLTEGWNSLKPVPTLANSLQLEKNLFGGWLAAEMERATAGKAPEESARDFMQSLVTLLGVETGAENDPQREALSHATIAMVRSGVDRYLADCDELIRIAGLGFAERKQKFREFEQELEKIKDSKEFSGRHFSRMFLPAVDRVADAEEGWSLRRKLLEVTLKGSGTGEAGILAAAKELGVDVRYIPSVGGFHLESPLSQEGKVEILKFGSGYRTTN